MADTIALVGGDTLLGQDVREVLAESSLGDRLRLVATEEDESGKLTEIGGAAAFLSKLEPDAVEDAAAIVLAGTEKAAREVLDTSPSGLIVDLTYVLEEQADARLRAPLLPAADEDGTLDGPQVVAHPAAVAIALLLNTLHKGYAISRALAHVFEPASERGKPGIEELQRQTVNLMAFQPLPKSVFDAQVSFSMLAQVGEESVTQLADIEERIERHLATLLDRLDGPPMPSLKLIQAPVFHGYTFSVWVEFEDAPSATEIEEAVAGTSIDVRGAGLEPPNNVSVAGQTGISVGSIMPDRNNANAVWIWMAADNLRLMAENAAMILREAI